MIAEKVFLFCNILNPIEDKTEVYRTRFSADVTLNLKCTML